MSTSDNNFTDEYPPEQHALASPQQQEGPPRLPAAGVRGATVLNEMSMAHLIASVDTAQRHTDARRWGPRVRW